MTLGDKIKLPIRLLHVTQGESSVEFSSIKFLKELAMFKILGSVVAALFLYAPIAQATIFSYTGQELSSGGHVEATANVEYSGAGVYVPGSGLTSFTVTGFDSTPSMRATVTAPTASLDGFTPYLSINSSGEVVSWFLLALSGDGSSDPYQYAYTLGYDGLAQEPGGCYLAFGGPCGTQDYYFFYSNVNDVVTYYVEENRETPGVWTSAQVPEPSSLALLAIAITGLAVSRRKRKQVV